MAESVSDSEYLGLITPHAALAQLVGAGFHASTAKAKIVERLLNGRVKSVAHRAFLPGLMGFEQAHDCMPISCAAWVGADIPEGFWKGDDLRLPRRGNLVAGVGAALYPDGPIRCLGVRFDRLGIDLIADDHKQSQAHLPSPQSAPKISRLPPPIRPLGTERVEPAEDPGLTEEEIVALAARLSRRRRWPPEAIAEAARKYSRRTAPLAADERQRRIPPPYRAQLQTAEARRLTKVTRDELRQWFSVYETQNQNFREDAVLEAAKTHFRPRPVTRQPIRDIIGEFDRKLTRGKPATL